MRWKCKKHKYIEPKIGDERVVPIFCVRPTKIDGYYYWFEKLVVLQRFIKEETYVYTSKNTSIPMDISHWNTIRVATYEDLGYDRYN